ncbi:MAG: c-type cytochrome [Gammaproteobacteria bacterium]
MHFRPAAGPVQMLAAICVLISACAPDSGTVEQSNGAGAALFDENCSPCHGQAVGVPTMTELRALAPDELRAGIRDHPTAGEIPQRLPAATMQTLIEYIED